MARTSASTADGPLASRAAATHVRGAESSSLFKYLPGFVYILVLFIAGKLMFPDPRATLVQWDEYHLSWVEVLMVGAAMMAMAEQLRVSHPGRGGRRLLGACFSVALECEAGPLNERFGRLFC
jgi:hypothetical protein